MEIKRNFKTISIALIIVGALFGFGYGMSSNVKPHDTPASSTPIVSEVPMVPANFSDLAEKVRPEPLRRFFRTFF